MRERVLRVLAALSVAVFLATLGIQVHRVWAANEGDCAPLICKTLDPSDIYWWYFECWRKPCQYPASLLPIPAKDGPCPLVP